MAEYLDLKPNSPTSSTSINDYDLLKMIGSGSYGTVYLARDKRDGQVYAIKKMIKSEIIRLKQVEHVLSEKQILSNIRNPFIVKYMESFQDNENLYVVMEYVEGGELFKYLRMAGKFPSRVAKFYAAEVIIALGYLHENNIIYRDLKPENIMLDAQAHIKIVDFGFAKRVEDRTWTICGTPDYMAPEIIQSKGHGKAADWWTLGILIYEMLVGYPPFYAQTPMQSYQKIVKGEFYFPSFLAIEEIDLIKQLLNGDLTRRLGNMSNGTADIMNHPWFRDVNWELFKSKPGNGIIRVKLENVDLKVEGDDFLSSLGNPDTEDSAIIRSEEFSNF
jgi:serine/threonine protein kinase